MQIVDASGSAAPLGVCQRQSPWFVQPMVSKLVSCACVKLGLKRFEHKVFLVGGPANGL